MVRKKILIIGATGFLGKTLIPKLENADYACLGISKSRSEKIGNTRVVRCDVTKIDQIRKVVQNCKPDVIIHLASLTGNTECELDPVRAFSTNILGTLNVLVSIKKLKCKIIFASSREVYGSVTKAVREESKLRPINVNGFTKMLSEYLIHNFHEIYHIPFVILRFTNFYGSKNSRGISAMIQNAMHENTIPIYGGEQIFDLLHIDDAANAILLSISHRQSNVFNIGTNESITPKKIIKKTEKLLGKKVKIVIKPYRYFEVRKFYVDTNKARNILHFKPKYNFDSGLRELMKIISENS